MDNLMKAHNGRFEEDWGLVVVGWGSYNYEGCAIVRWSHGDGVIGSMSLFQN
jgi:hypothetical protein